MVFSFVEMDVSEKRGILRDLYESDAENYETVEKMVDFECFENDTKVEPKNRGSRTLLRLHRALAFLIKFIEGLQRSESAEKSVVSHFQSAYRETLANHHTWFVRQSVSFASHTIPNRDRLLDAIFNENEDDEKDGVEDDERVNKLAANLVEALNNVYNRVQRIYTERDLLSLSWAIVVHISFPGF